MTRLRGSDRGAGTVLTAVVVMGIAMALVLAVWAIGWMTSARRADRAADLAALAGATAVASGRDGCGAASLAARRNDATLTDCTVDGSPPSFVVKVQVGVELLPRVTAPGAPRRVVAKAAAGPG